MLLPLPLFPNWWKMNESMSQNCFYLCTLIGSPRLKSSITSSRAWTEFCPSGPSAVACEAVSFHVELSQTASDTRSSSLAEPPPCLNTCSTSCTACTPFCPCGPVWTDPIVAVLKEKQFFSNFRTSISRYVMPIFTDIYWHQL